MSETVATGGEGTSHYQPQGDRVDVLARSEHERALAAAGERTRIVLGHKDQWMRMAREADEEVKTLRQQLQGAVEENASLRAALVEIRDAHEPDDPIFTAAAAALCRPALGGQSSPAGCPACSPDPTVARPPHTCSGEQS